jgi:membrane peptidoglycan carboxypeptidase
MQKILTIIGKTVLGLLSVAGSTLLVVAVWLVWHYEYGIGLPDESKLATLAATGPACPVGDPGAYTPLTEIPPLIRKAVLAYEDPDFYERSFASPLTRLGLAALSNRIYPWSSISSSVTRGCLMALSPGCCRGLDWHVGNVVLMGRVERTLSRDRILEIYMNEMYFGRNAHGITAAATAYFGKPLAELDVDEIAFIVTRPRQSSPSQHFDTTRRDFAIDKMLKAGAINETQAVSAKGRPLVLKEKSTSGPNKPDSL